MVHAVYHYDRCSRCGQLDVKDSGRVDVSVDKKFLFKLFFLGYFSACLPNIYFSMLECLSTLDLLLFEKWFINTLLHNDIEHFCLVLGVKILKRRLYSQRTYAVYNVLQFHLCFLYVEIHYISLQLSHMLDICLKYKPYNKDSKVPAVWDNPGMIPWLRVLEHTGKK